MSLRRTALVRKTQLRRTPMPPRSAGLARRAAKATRRPRDTGPSRATRAVLLGRSGGWCEVCGRLLHDGTTWLGPHSVHHRRPRGAGGSSWDGINLPSNLLLLCGDATSSDGCHAFIEAYRTSAYGEGWLVRQSQDPVMVPVTVYAGAHLTADRFTRRVLLTDDGDYQEVAA